MDPEIEVLLVIATQHGSGVVPIVESAGLRPGYVKFQAISSTDARERAFQVSWCTVRRVATHDHMLESSLRVKWRGNLVDGLPRPASDLQRRGTCK